MPVPLGVARAGAGAALVLASAVLSGCSPATAMSPTASAPTTPTTSAPSPAIPRCTTVGLSGRLEAQDPGAGHRYATLVLTNTGARACTVFGYGGVGLAPPTVPRCRRIRSASANRPPRRWWSSPAAR